MVVYVNDMLVNRVKVVEHLAHFYEMFSILKKHKCCLT